MHAVNYPCTQFVSFYWLLSKIPLFLMVKRFEREELEYGNELVNRFQWPDSRFSFNKLKFTMDV